MLVNGAHDKYVIDGTFSYPKGASTWAALNHVSFLTPLMMFLFEIIEDNA